MPSQPKKFWSLRAVADGELECLIYDEIHPYWGVTAKDFQRELKAAGAVKTIRLRINSPGGSIFEGMAIFNILRAHPARKIVTVEGVAASMASVIAMVGDEIEVPANAFMMIHNPLAGVDGESADLRKMADLLDRMKATIVDIYAGRSKKPADEIAQLMDAETWMTGKECLAAGFCDRCPPAVAAAAVCDLTHTAFGKVPEALKQETTPAAKSVFNPVTPEGTSAMADTTTTTQSAPQPAAIADLKAACPGADNDFLVAQLTAAATVDNAAKAWTAELATRLVASQKETATAKAAATPAKPKEGAQVLTTGSNNSDAGGSTDPIVAWNEALAAKIRAMNGNRARATAALVRENPEMHTAYLAAYNSQHGRPFQG